MSTIEETIAAAKLAAANNTGAGLPATTPDYAPPAMSGTKLPGLWDVVDSAATPVDGYFGITPDGFRVIKDAPLVEEFEALLDGIMFMAPGEVLRRLT